MISERKMIEVIFMDLKRAFETIDREKLLGKLYQYGIRNKAQEWIWSYFSGRVQQVTFDNKWSCLLNTEYGMPQGPVRAFIVYNIYKRYRKVCSDKYNTKMFANDMSIYVSDDGNIK